MALVHQVEQDATTAGAAVGGTPSAARRAKAPDRPAPRAKRGVPASTRLLEPQVQPFTVQSVRLRPLVRVTAVVALGAFVAVVLGSVTAWWLARATGRLGAVESFLAEAFGLEAFSFPTGAILTVWVGFAAAALALAATIFVLLAVMYNRIATVVGGIEVEVGAAARRPA